MHPSSNCDHRLVGPSNSGQATPWHPRVTAYGCYLPVLTRFTGPRRTGPNHQRHLAKQSRQPSSPRRGIRPRYSGFRVQGTASSPSSTTKRIVHEDGRSGKNEAGTSRPFGFLVLDQVDGSSKCRSLPGSGFDERNPKGLTLEGLAAPKTNITRCG